MFRVTGVLSQIFVYCPVEIRSTSEHVTNVICQFSQQLSETKITSFKNTIQITQTSFEKHNLVILRQIDESRYQFGKLDNLLHFVGQSLRRFDPKFFICLRKQCKLKCTMYQPTNYYFYSQKINKTLIITQSITYSKLK